MHALFKLDKRISWQWGLLNIAMDYDISFTGDFKKIGQSHKFGSAQRQRNKDYDLWSLVMLWFLWQSDHLKE